MNQSNVESMKEHNDKELIDRRVELFKKIKRINKVLSKRGKNHLSLKEGLGRTYEVKTQTKGAREISCRITLPLCFIGEKVKLKCVKSEQGEQDG